MRRSHLCRLDDAFTRFLSKICGSKDWVQFDARNIFNSSFSILRLQQHLERPRVAAPEHHFGCDEWNQNSDELNG
jgi:hypothetical protein